VQLNPFYSRPLRGLADLGGPLAAEYQRRCAALNPPLEPIAEK